MYKGTRAVVTTGILAAIAIMLAVTGWGLTPPLILGVSATVMHVPVIIAAVLSGWPSGCMVGIIFGVYSLVQAAGNPSPANVMFMDPLVAVLPRALIGITAYLAYTALRRANERLAVGVAAVIGTLTNTVGVLGIGVLRGYLPPLAALTIGAPYGLVESIFAVVLTVAVWEALRAARGGAVRKANL